MNDARKSHVPPPARAERNAQALVAQYIHELSGRHAAARTMARELDGARS